VADKAALDLRLAALCIALEGGNGFYVADFGFLSKDLGDHVTGGKEAPFWRGEILGDKFTDGALVGLLLEGRVGCQFFQCAFVFGLLL